MKYYVYAGYYENFISGHKLPKPYTLRNEFKTFDEALDYVWENWEDNAIFFTEDVIGDVIDNGFIDDENWKDFLMEESKNSARKSLKEAKPTNYRGIHINVTYAMGYDYYVIPQINKGKKWNEKTLFATLKEVKQYIDDHYDELVELCNVKESKKSARKSIKESSDESYLDEVRGFYFSNLDVGEECEVQFADFVMPCRISQFYKDHRYVYLIAETIRGEELYFVITYAYIRNKFVLSKYFSSYGKAKNELLNKISSVL